jgi:hypothetical protein
MKKIINLFFIATCAALLTGCASGPRFNDVKATFPAVGPDNGRIFFYRDSVAGAAVQPSVKLNGEEIGTAKPKGFFYVDRAPGTYEVATTTEVKRSLSLTLDKGQTRYVRFNIAIGFFVGHVYPELVENEVGEKEIASCKYTGSK